MTSVVVLCVYLHKLQATSFAIEIVMRTAHAMRRHVLYAVTFVLVSPSVAIPLANHTSFRIAVDILAAPH